MRESSAKAEQTWDTLRDGWPSCCEEDDDDEVEVLRVDGWMTVPPELLFSLLPLPPEVEYALRTYDPDC